MVGGEDLIFCGLKVKHIRNIIDLILDGRETDKSLIDIVEEILAPSIFAEYNGNRLNINIPIKLKATDAEFYKYGYEIHIYDNGLINYNNGSDVMMRFENPLEIYKIIVENFKPEYNGIEE